MIQILEHKRLVVILSIIILIFIAILAIPVGFFKVSYSTVVFDRNGQLMGAHIADDGQWRFPLSDSIPSKFENSILLFEDEYFYYHPGINPYSMMRALWQNFSRGKIVSGGSTITMQTIRISKPCSRTIWNKMVEMVKAFSLELKYSKKEILNLYASNAPFGGNVVGLESASWRYFGCSPQQLSWAEAATLAVLPNAPGLIHPGRNRDLLLNKRNRLLHKLLLNGDIDSMEYSISVDEPIIAEPNNLPSLAPHLLDYFLKTGIQRGQSTLKYTLQDRANGVVQRHAGLLLQNQIHNAAALIIDNRTKEVLVYIGNINSLLNSDNGNDVDVIMKPRSSGSILKPLLYAACLQDGMLLPQSLLPDVPMYYRDFSPQNYSRGYDGAVKADDALSRSLNLPAVKLLEDYGVDRFLSRLRHLGITSMPYNADHYGLSLILGGAETTLWDLGKVYSSMAQTLYRFSNSNGVYSKDDWAEPLVYYKDYSNKSVSTVSETPNEFNASSIWFTFKAMQNVHRPDEETGWEQYENSRRIAWKTGTSFGYRDGWAVGVTPEYTVAVWVGNASGEGRPGITGGSTAAPIMFDLFQLLPNTTWFTAPYDDLTKVKVCRTSGFIATSDCEDIDSLFVPDVESGNLTCSFHRLVHLDAERLFQVSSDCYPPSKMNHVKWFVLPPVMEWFYKQKHPMYRSLPNYLPGCNANESSPMELIYPPKNATVFLPRNFNGEFEKIVIQMTHRKSSAHVYWHLDDNYIGETYRFHQKELFFKPGWHTITMVDDMGNKLSTRINCLGESK